MVQFKTLCFHCQGGFTRCQGTKIPQAARHSQKRKKNVPNDSDAHLKFERHSSGLETEAGEDHHGRMKRCDCEIITQHFVDTSESRKAPQVK